MREWVPYVRERLRLPELRPGREAEIVEELAQQLADARREALEGGATEAEALARVHDHVPEWEALRKELLAHEKARVPRLERWTDGLEQAVAARSGFKGWIGSWWVDLLFGLRVLARSPAFTAIAVLTLALGTGATTAIFSVVSAVLLRPLPYPQPDRIVMAFDVGTAPGGTRARPSPGNFLDWRAQNDVFDGLTAWYQPSRTLRGDGPAAQVRTAQVAGDFFEVFGVAPAIGRVFTHEESPGALYNEANLFVGGDRVAVLSDGFWRRRFGADPGVVDRDINLDGVTWRVVGVMPPGYGAPDSLVDLWVPWDLARSYDPQRFPDGPPRDYRFLNVAGRMRAGVTLEQAESNLALIASDLEARFPGPNRGWSVRLEPLHEEMVRRGRPALILLLAAVGFVLLIACANVAGLLVARASARAQEIAIRSALGAGRLRLLRQLLSESVLLSLGGAAAGLLFAYAGLDLLVALAPPGLPRLDETRIDGGVLAFTLLVAIATGLMFGLAPAIAGSRTDLLAGLREGGRSGASAGRARSRLRSGLVAAEIASALVLLAGAGLFARSFARIISVEPGFDTKNLLVMRIFLDTEAYGESGQASQYYDTLLSRLQGLPGVTAVAATTVLPMSDVGVDFDRPYWREGEDLGREQAPEAGIRMVTPSYFSTLRIPVREGRAFTEADRFGGPPVILVNETLARQVWPGLSPIGRRLVIDYKRARHAYEVVGVAGDTRAYGLKSRPEPEIFIPHAQNPYLAMNVVLRTVNPPADLSRAVEGEAQALDPAQPVHSVVTMDRLLQSSLAPDRFAMTLLSVLALIALLLAAVGLYGMTAYLVGLRTREFGVRMALGAAPRSILAMVLRQSCRLAAAGALVGLAGALALTRFVNGLLYGVGSTDPTAFVAAVLILAAATIGAAWIPARRVLRIDPVVALRHE